MEEKFDYAIIGAGAAGLHLAMSMANDDFFDDKSILILDKSDKTENDRTWSFWEKGKTQWDEIALKTWSTGEFHCSDFSKSLDLKDYFYKTIRSSEFYQFAKTKIKSKPNFFWKKKEVEAVSNSSKNFVITSKKESFISEFVFDSRIEPDFFQKNNSHIKLLQHFKGWFIKTTTPSFDPNRFVMMDFRLRWKDHTSFTYVLPFSKTEAIVEFTLFDQEVLKDHEYDEKLKQYISEYLKIKDYEIIEEEKGVIPMTDYPFQKSNNNNFSKIGTAGGWVKPSSGYAFKFCEKYSLKIIDNLKKGQTPSYQLFSKKYLWYDSLLLDILWNKNHLGASIFAAMFKRNDIRSIFKFLDNEGNLASDFHVIKSFQPTPFIQALGKKIFK